MSAYDEILASLPIDQLAASLGESPDAVEQAAYAALPALLGGLQANAQDPAGEASLAAALGQHDDALATGAIDLARIDVADGEKITQHIFGAQQDQVIQQLGGAGGSSGLVAKLLPILAPIVLSFLAKQLGQQGGQSGAQSGGQSGGPSGGGVLGGILSEVLEGASQGAGASRAGSPDMGSILGDLLGGLLGGGRR